MVNHREVKRRGSSRNSLWSLVPNVKLKGWRARSSEKIMERRRGKTKSFQGLCDVDTLGLWGRSRDRYVSCSTPKYTVAPHENRAKLSFFSPRLFPLSFLVNRWIRPLWILNASPFSPFNLLSSTTREDARRSLPPREMKIPYGNLLTTNRRKQRELFPRCVKKKKGCSEDRTWKSSTDPSAP